MVNIFLEGYKIKGYSPEDAAIGIKKFKNKCGTADYLEMLLEPENEKITVIN